MSTTGAPAPRGKQVIFGLLRGFFYCDANKERRGTPRPDDAVVHREKLQGEKRVLG